MLSVELDVSKSLKLQHQVGK